MNTPPPAFMGEACEMGDTEPCTCEDGGEGTKVCRYNASSPTMGEFSMCEACQAPEPPPEAGSGAAGTGGMGSSGTGASGTGASGTGASGTGASGTGASGTGASEPECNPRDCERPLLGEACCTQRGECGVRLLLSCNAR